MIIYAHMKFAISCVTLISYYEYTLGFMLLRREMVTSKKSVVIEFLITLYKKEIIVAIKTRFLFHCRNRNCIP